MPLAIAVNVGDLIQFRGRRGSIQGIVTGLRRVCPRKRPSYIEFQVKPTADAREGSYYNVPYLLVEKNFGSVSGAELSAAKGAVLATQHKIIESKENRREGAMHLISLLDILSGDRILIRGRNTGHWHANVLMVRPYRGRVGIERRNFRSGDRSSVRWIWPFCIISNETADIRRRARDAAAQPVVNNEAEVEDEAAVGDDKE